MSNDKNWMPKLYETLKDKSREETIQALNGFGETELLMYESFVKGIIYNFDKRIDEAQAELALIDADLSYFKEKAERDIV